MRIRTRSRITHGVPALHHWTEEVSARLGGFFGALAPAVINGLVGILAGAVVVAVVMGVKKVLPKRGAEARG